MNWFPIRDYPTPEDIRWLVETTLAERVVWLAMGDRRGRPRHLGAAQVVSVAAAVLTAWVPTGLLDVGPDPHLVVGEVVATTATRFAVMEVRYQGASDRLFARGDRVGVDRIRSLVAADVPRSDLRLFDGPHPVLRLDSESFLEFRDSGKAPGNVAAIRGLVNYARIPVEVTT